MTQRTKKPGEPLVDGFFHSLGHGVGLEVHEAPGLGQLGEKPLVAGDCITIEPGLYRQGYGGVRLEDNVLVTADGCRESHEVSVRPRALADDARRSLDRDDVPRGAERIRPPRSSPRRRTPSRRSTTSRSRSSGSGRDASGSTWFEPFTELYTWEPPYAQWYLGGKLNVCFNCVDRHVEAGAAEKVAFHWEGEPADETRAITYADLQRDVVRFANALKKLGVKKGTPVAIYMGMVPELPVAMLACTRLGAPHTVVFGGFSADSLSGRMNDMQCEVLITQDEAWRRGSTVPLKKVADEAMADAPVTTAERRPPPHRQRRADAGRPRPLVARARGRLLRRRRVVPVRADGQRGPALPHVHERHDREAEGDRPHDRRLPRRRRHDAPLHLRPEAGRRMSTGAPPTSAGSPATATSSTGRCATARRPSSTRGRRTTRTRTAGGRSSSATA